MKRWRPVFVCLTSLLAILVIFSTRFKTLDLVLIAILFGGRVTLGTLAATQFRLHHDPMAKRGSVIGQMQDSDVLALWFSHQVDTLAFSNLKVSNGTAASSVVGDW